MNNEIRERIDAELPPGGTPLRLDADTVVSASRARRTRRRLAGGGAALASIAAVVALVLSVMTLAPGDGDPKPDDAATGTDTDTDEPVVDPDEEYYWWGPQSEKGTDAAKAYTKALWEYIAEAHPDVSLKVRDENAEQDAVTEDFADYSFLLAAEYGLYEGEEFKHMQGSGNEEPVRTRTMLTLFQDAYPYKGGPDSWSSCCGATLKFRDGDDKKDKVDSFGIEVYPKGSFTKGTEDVMDPAFLGDDVTHDIDTVEGPDGEVIQYVAGSVPDDVDGTVHTFERSAIVFRADGSAVAVRAKSNTDRGGNVSDNLDFEDLRGIALALPTTPLP